MIQLTKQTLRRSMIAACCAWLITAADAAGLGGLTVHSALGQPLSAEIEVSALPADEFARVVARIAGPDDYQAAKLAYPPFLRQLRVAEASN